MRRCNSVLAVAAGAAATIALAACGSSDSSSQETGTSGSSATSSASTTAATTAASAAGKKIVFIGDVAVPTDNAMQCGMQPIAKAAGVDFQFQVPDAYDPAKQISILNAVMAQHPDVIIISPDDAKALVTPLKQAASQGIKIVLMAHKIDDNSFVSTIVTNDDEGNGRIAADILAKKIGDKKGKVAFLGYTPGASTITDARQKGFEDEIKKYPNLEYIGPTVINTLKAEDGAAAANALMSAHPDLIGLAANGEDYSLGMAQAVVQRGLKDKITTVQMDAEAKGVKALKTGALDGTSTVVWSDLGAAAMKQAVDIAAGKSVPKEAPPVKAFAVTMDNVDSPEVKRAALAPTKPC